MNNQTIYWVWIQQLCGYGSVIPSTIRQRYTFAEDFYRAPYEEKALCLGKSDGKLSFSDISNRKLHNTKRIIDYCKSNDIEIVVPGDVYYPQRLLSLRNHPAALYVKGDVSLLRSKLSIGVVGTRHPSFFGEFMTKGIVEGLVDNSITIVSGGAIGIDTIAHKTTLYSNGKTVCVLGCGIGYNYLAQNRSMYEEISRSGLLVSEYIPMSPTGKLTFKIRDRLISGLSSGVAVIEASEKSGSLITANYALKQKRKLYALRKPDGSAVSPGTEAAIRSGAKPFVVYNDILGDCQDEIDLLGEAKEEPEKKFPEKIIFEDIEPGVVHTIDFEKYIKRYKGKDAGNSRDTENSEIPEAELPDTLNINAANERINDIKPKVIGDKAEAINTASVISEKPDAVVKPAEASAVQEQMLDYLTETAKEVYRCMTTDMIHIDTILFRIGSDISVVSSALTELELYGLIETYQGNMYKKI